MTIVPIYKATSSNIKSRLAYVYRSKTRAEVPTFGSVPGVISGVPENDHRLLLSRLHHNHAGVKHLVFSASHHTGKGTDWRQVFVDVAKCFSKEFCHNAYHIGAVHQDTAHPHAHVLFANSDGHHALHWPKGTMSKMQGLSWIPKEIRESWAIASSRGISFSTGSRNYPTQKTAYILAPYFDEHELNLLEKQNPFVYKDECEPGYICVFGKTLWAKALTKGIRIIHATQGAAFRPPPPGIIRPRRESELVYVKESPAPTVEESGQSAFTARSQEEIAKAAAELARLPQSFTPEWPSI